MLRQARQDWTIHPAPTGVAGSFGYGCGLDLDRGALARTVVGSGPSMRTESREQTGKAAGNPVTTLP